jgi:hypothetical protein
MADLPDTIPLTEVLRAKILRIRDLVAELPPEYRDQFKDLEPLFEKIRRAQSAPLDTQEKIDPK